MTRFIVKLFAFFCRASRSSIVPALLVFVVVAPAVRASTTITLRPISTLGSADESDAPRGVVLADIADISGDDAEYLRRIQIAGDASKLPHPRPGVAQIDLAAVRNALYAAKVNMGRVSLDAGMLADSRAELIFAKPEPVPAATTPTSRASTTFSIVDLSGPWTIRKAISARLVSHFDADASTVQLAFSERDAQALDVLVTADQRVEIEPGAATTSERLPVRVTVYLKDRILRANTFDIQARIQRTVQIAAANIDRNQPITPELVRSETRWLPPGVNPFTDLFSHAPSPVAVRSIPLGHIIAPADVQAAIACKRGDVVWVHCLSGNVTVKAKARALENARDGEFVTLRLESASSSDKSTIRARMSGRGQAVMDLNSQDQLTP